MIVFGGAPQFPPVFNDVWALSLTDSLQWMELRPIGDSVPPLFDSAFAYDPTHDRLLILGGFDSAADHQLWSLQLGEVCAWSPIDVAGSRPAKSINARAVYDVQRDGFVVFGGLEADTWELSFKGSPSWTEIEPGDDGNPGPRVEHAAAYDLLRGRVLEYGGWFNVAGSGPTLNLSRTLWQLTFEPRIEWHSIVRDSNPLGDCLIMFGGNFSPFQGDLPLENPVWQLALSGHQAWKVLDAGEPPTGRYYHSAIYDALRRRMIVFGGRTESAVLDDAWVLTLDGVPHWARLQTQGDGPGARFAHSAVYDPVGDRMILFGGSDGTTRHDDTWQLTLSGTPAWSQIETRDRPPAQAAGPMMAYDSRRQRLVLFQSEYRLDGGPGTTWVLPLAPGSNWMRASNVGASPAARAWASVVYAPDRDRLILLQGSSRDASINANNETWLMASSVMVPTVASLARLDAGPWRVLLQWTGSTSPPQDFTVERRTAMTPWVSIGSPTADGSGRMTYIDLAAAPLGRYAYRLSWSIGAAAQTTPEIWVDVPQLRFALAGPTENPSINGLTVALSLVDASPVRLEVMDVAGRRLVSREVGVLGPGDHHVEVGKRGALPAGIYLIRLTGGHESRVVRSCVIR
jgi:hypothetical protein